MKIEIRGHRKGWCDVDDNEGNTIISNINVAQAERIVACVNACEGIDTEQLMIVTDAEETLDFCYKRLEQQRDVLLKALRDIANTNLHFSMSRKNAQEAIDKCS